MKIQRILSILVMLPLLFVGITNCDKKIPAELELAITELLMGKEGGEAKVEFIANKDWTANTSATWCELSQTSGSASQCTFNVFVQPNPTFEERSCTINITVEGIKASITVNQSNNTGLIISPASVNIDNREQDVTMTINHNVELDVVIPVEYHSWIDFAKTKALQTSDIVFHVAANEEYDPRSAQIMVKSKDGSLTDVFTINQGETYGLFIDETSYKLSNSSHQLTVGVKANIEYSATSNAEWIKVIPATKGLSQSNIVLEIDANEGYDERTGTISVKQVNGDLEGIITITQAENYGIFVSQELFEVSKDYHDLEVEVKYNVEYDIFYDKTLEMIIVDDNDESETKALQSKNYNIRVFENRSYSQREVSVTFKQRGGDLSGTVRIVQAPTEVIQLNESTKNLGNQAESFTVGLYTNLSPEDVAVSIPTEAASWLSLKESKKVEDNSNSGLSLYEYTFEATDNEGEARSADISFTNTTLGLSAVFTVNQERKQIAKPFIIKVKGEEVNLPIAGDYGEIECLVDWGDGTTETYTYAHPSHKYTDGQDIHTVSILGRFPTLESDVYNNIHYITEVVSWGLIEGLTSMLGAMSYQTYLEKIPDDEFGCFANVTTFYRAFQGCTSLKEIPSGLFRHARNATNFDQVFEITNISSIPADLFYNCTEATSFFASFRESGVRSVPDRLFSKNTKVECFGSVFYWCKKLKTIGEGVFENATKVKDVRSVFSVCENLEAIPNDIFKDMISATDFEGAFEDCHTITSIPSGLFDNCKEAENFNYAFKLCKSLESVPDYLFAKNTKAQSFQEAFGNCHSLKTIGKGVFDNCTQATDLSRIFEWCTSLVELPDGLFSHCVNAQTFSMTFWHCSSLKTLSKNLFANCSAVYSISGLFMECESLTSVYEGIFDEMTNLENCSRLFYECHSLKSVPTSLFDNSKKVFYLGQAFWNCKSLSGESPYTVIDGVKTHLYERTESNGFVEPYGSSCFNECKGLSDYNQIPDYWK